MRLIDADKIRLSHFEIIRCRGNYKEALARLVDKIDKLPTAYDVDKVVEGLEKSAAVKPVGCAASCELIALKDAVEVVKKGGVDDDVCMWREEDLGLITSCGNIVRAYSDDFEYCPYCSRKIEVTK